MLTRSRSYVSSELMAIYAAPDLPHCNRALGQAINDDGVPQHALIIFAKSRRDSLSLTPVLLTSPLVQESRRATAPNRYISATSATHVQDLLRNAAGPYI